MIIELFQGSSRSRSESGSSRKAAGKKQSKFLSHTTKRIFDTDVRDAETFCTVYTAAHKLALCFLLLAGSLILRFQFKIHVFQYTLGAMTLWYNV